MLDLQFEMCRLARERVSEKLRMSPAKRSSIAVVVADAQALPFVAGEFDTAFLAVMLGEVPDKDACLHEVGRVLRSGGVMGIAETRRDSDFISLSKLRALADSCGFTFSGRRGGLWQYVARFTRLSQI
jgi:ubiquinone/menaquinone biosynthesis C-methylase UbiE